MIWSVVMQLFSTLMDLIQIARLNERDKDLEILLLRQQLEIAERKLHKPVRASRAERLTIAVLTTKLRSSGRHTIEQLRQIIRIFQPETALGWRRQLVKRKWSYDPEGRGTRPNVDHKIMKAFQQFPIPAQCPDCQVLRFMVDQKLVNFPIHDRASRLVFARNEHEKTPF